MGRLLALASLLAGCGFHGPPLVADDMPGDGPAECTAGFLDLCAQAAPTTPLDLTISETINTDLDLRCRPQGQVGGGDVCLLYATSVMIHGGVTLSATGTRPLAIASTSTFALEGAIDVSSHAGLRGAAADAAACNFAAMPASDTGGGGGGAGGSFGQPGGDGGIGDKNNNGDPPGAAAAGQHGGTVAIAALRGGCRGQTGGNQGGGGSGIGGPGGHSGGALYLFARGSLALSGDVRATGAGGEGGGGMSGGGGGGSGGMIAIESPQVMISGSISANGGGGGQGGGVSVGGVTLVPGNPGADGTLGATPAVGGSGALVNDPGFGPGGAGGAMSAAAAGIGADFGGGGGGGAAGVIVVRGQSQLSGTISPMPALQ